MVESIFIINEEGETLASLKLGTFDADVTLIGGFMSAIQSFSERMSGDSIQQLQVGEHRMLVSFVEGYYVVTVHEQGDGSARSVNHKIVDICKEHIADGVNDSLLEKIQKAADAPVTAGEKASEWADKML